MKTCACGRAITRTGNRTTRCAYCNAADPHYHSGRGKPEMFVSVDIESKWCPVRNRQVIITLSFGREDGTSETWYGDDAPTAFVWLIDRLAAPYTDAGGRAWRQVAVAFHFGHDTAVLANGLNTDDMELIRRAGKRIETGICRSQHLHEGTPCRARRYDKGLLHAYDRDDIYAVLTDGIHSDLVSWHRPTGLAMAFGTGQGAYLEHRPNGDRYEGWRKLSIRDTGRAFIGGLEKVLDEWNPELEETQRAAIAWGKKARVGGFAGASTDQIAAYSEAECVAHARTCRMLLDAISKAAHVPMKPHQLGGSGSIAAAVMRHYGVTKRTETHTEEWIDNIAPITYFGGMIETPVVGLIAGHVDEEDINSAYPSQMIHMPCMRAGHGRWVTGRHGVVPEGEIGHALVSWSIRPGRTSTPPFITRRQDGRVAQTLRQDHVWTTLAELRTANDLDPESVFVHKTVVWVEDCTCGNPFEFLSDLYSSRLATRAEMASLQSSSAHWAELDAIQRTIKLIINSIYGKLAQTRPEPGPYTNLHYASYITGATRAQVRRKTWEREAENATVVYQHTDSVLSIGGNVGAGGGKALGAWGLEKPTEGFLILQPGLATTGDPNQGKTASRGARKNDFIDAANGYRDRVDFTEHPAYWPKLVIKTQAMISLRAAVARGNVELAGSFEDRDVKVTIVSDKRDFYQAVQLPNCPTAWAVPPIDTIEDPIRTLDDMKPYQSALDRRRRAGEFDT